ncbi:hypothetical protein ACFL7E_05035, partial [Thermodesulfobacteriota bacterium]
MKVQETGNSAEVATFRPEIKKWVFPLFIVAMTLCISATIFMTYLASSTIGYNVLSALETQKDFANFGWDDFCYIPRMNAVANGHLFSDPWNSHNPDYWGWGTFGLLPALVGGFFIYLFDHFFLAMSMWGLVNFPLIILIIYFIFRSSPINCSSATSILCTFLLMNQLWFASQPLSWFLHASPT